MTLLIITSLLLTIRLSLLITSNPLGIGLFILITALVVAALYGISISSWLAFIIFLIYVGGILVIFAYFLALTPNIQILYSSSTSISVITFSLTSCLLSPAIFYHTMPINTSSRVIELLFLHPNQPALTLLILTLFLTLIIVVKVSNTNKGPLRAFISYV